MECKSDLLGFDGSVLGLQGSYQAVGPSQHHPNLFGRLWPAECEQARQGW